MQATAPRETNPSEPSAAPEMLGDRITTGDRAGDGVDAPGVFNAGISTVHLRSPNTRGGADKSYPRETTSWIPVAGSFGALTSPMTTDLDGAPPDLA